MLYTEATSSDWLAAWHQGFAAAGLNLMSFQWRPALAAVSVGVPRSLSYTLPEAPYHVWYVYGFGSLIQHDCRACGNHDLMAVADWLKMPSYGCNGRRCEHDRRHTIIPLILPPGPDYIDLIVDKWLGALIAVARDAP